MKKTHLKRVYFGEYLRRIRAAFALHKIYIYIHRHKAINKHTFVCLLIIYITMPIKDRSKLATEKHVSRIERHRRVMRASRVEHGGRRTIFLARPPVSARVSSEFRNARPPSLLGSTFRAAAARFPTGSQSDHVRVCNYGLA